ncbi:hypothetical protein J0X15_04475 [Roseibium sp. CAU 1637]|uniref:Uncharacterized protein n=1 Tax=Roseibium limicola TaxID=2816037 RepID=A0A939EKR5_9HYPH|nr:hypothetical protein [Roseibium limicola]MBO0344470.1 hypothetical protein [Roseibium limicola]
MLMMTEQAISNAGFSAMQGHGMDPMVEPWDDGAENTAGGDPTSRASHPHPGQAQRDPGPVSHGAVSGTPIPAPHFSASGMAKDQIHRLPPSSSGLFRGSSLQQGWMPGTRPSMTLESVSPHSNAAVITGLDPVIHAMTSTTSRNHTTWQRNGMDPMVKPWDDGTGNTAGGDTSSRASHRHPGQAQRDPGPVSHGAVSGAQIPALCFTASGMTTFEEGARL